MLYVKAAVPALELLVRGLQPFPSINNNDCALVAQAEAVDQAEAESLLPQHPAKQKSLLPQTHPPGTKAVETASNQQVPGTIATSVDTTTSVGGPARNEKFDRTGPNTKQNPAPITKQPARNQQSDCPGTSILTSVGGPARPAETKEKPAPITKRPAYKPQFDCPGSTGPTCVGGPADSKTKQKPAPITKQPAYKPAYKPQFDCPGSTGPTRVGGPAHNKNDRTGSADSKTKQKPAPITTQPAYKPAYKPQFDCPASTGPIIKQPKKNSSRPPNNIYESLDDEERRERRAHGVRKAFGRFFRCLRATPRFTYHLLCRCTEDGTLDDHLSWGADLCAVCVNSAEACAQCAGLCWNTAEACLNTCGFCLELAAALADGDD